MKDQFLALFSSILIVILFILLICVGWYIVWKVILSRFRFVRELLGNNNESSSIGESRDSRYRTKSRRD